MEQEYIKKKDSTFETKQEEKKILDSYANTRDFGKNNV